MTEDEIKILTSSKPHFEALAKCWEGTENTFMKKVFENTAKECERRLLSAGIIS